MLRDFSQYDIVDPKKMIKVKQILDSYSGDGESDVCETLHQWVFSWYKCATACTTLKKLEKKYEKKNFKELVDFALTYETIRPNPKPRDNRDLGSTMSMNMTSPAMSMNIEYINRDI